MNLCPAATISSKRRKAWPSKTHQEKCFFLLCLFFFLPLLWKHFRWSKLLFVATSIDPLTWHLHLTFLPENVILLRNFIDTVPCKRPGLISLETEYLISTTTSEVGPFCLLKFRYAKKVWSSNHLPSEKLGYFRVFPRKRIPYVALKLISDLYW